MGSRNGHTPLFLWYAIEHRGYNGFKQEAEVCLAGARYLHERLIEFQYPAFLNKYSNIVFFKKPSPRLAKNDS